MLHEQRHGRLLNCRINLSCTVRLVVSICATCLLCACGMVSPFNYEDHLRLWQQLREQSYRACVANDLSLALQKGQEALNEAAKLNRSGPLMLTSLNDLASLYKESHQLDRSRQYYEKALDLCFSNLKAGSNSALPTNSMITTLLNLANIYRDQHNHSRAESLYKLALVVNRSGLMNARTSIRESQILIDYAKLLDETGRSIEARQLVNEAGQITRASSIIMSAALSSLKMLINTQFSGSPGVAPDGSWIASIIWANHMYHKGDAAKAYKYAQRAVIEAEKFGSDDVRLAIALKALASMEPDVQKSEQQYERAIAILEATVGDKDDNTKQCLSYLAGKYQSEKKFALSEPLVVKLYNVRSSVDPSPGGAFLAGQMSRLGEFYAKQRNDNQRALEYYKKALSVAQHTPQAWQFLPQVLVNISSTYCDMGDYDKSKKYAQQGIDEAANFNDLAMKCYGLTHYGIACRKSHQYDQAESFLARAIAEMDKWQPKSDEAARARMRLADLYAEQKRNKDEELAIKQVLATVKSMPAETIPSISDELKRYPWTLYGDGRKAAAEDLVREMIALIKEKRTHDPNALWWWQDSLVRMYIGDNKAQLAQNTSTELIATSDQIKPVDQGLAAQSLNELAVSHYLAGKTADANRIQNEAISSSAKGKDPDQAIFWQLQLSQWLFDHGDFLPAQKVCELLMTCEQRLNQAQKTNALLLLAACCARAEDFEKADKWLDKSLSLGHQTGTPEQWKSAEQAFVPLQLIYSSNHRSSAKLEVLNARLAPKVR